MRVTRCSKFPKADHSLTTKCPWGDQHNVLSTRVCAYAVISRGTDPVPRIFARRVSIVQTYRCTSTNKDAMNRRRPTSCLFDGIPDFLPSPRHLSSPPVYPSCFPPTSSPAAPTHLQLIRLITEPVFAACFQSNLPNYPRNKSTRQGTSIGFSHRRLRPQGLPPS